MFRRFADMRRIKRSGWASAIVMLACSLTMRAAQRGGTLFLLTGTSLVDTSQTFPARLYTVTTDHRLKLFREVVSGNEGITEVLDDTGQKIYVAFPSNTGLSRAPTKVSIIHKRDPAVNDVMTFNPRDMLDYPQATATAAGQDLNSYALYTLFPAPGAGVDNHVAFMQFISSSATTLVAISGNPPTKGPRVTRNDWSLYSHLTFYGSPGGPAQYLNPRPMIENGDLIFHLGGQRVSVDRAPPYLSAEDNGLDIRIVASNRRFLISWLFRPTDRSAPASLYVHDRLSNTWKELKFRASLPQCRIFGAWLASIAMSYKGTASGPEPDNNPGHMDEGDRWVRYERPNVRLEYGSIRLDYRIPGILILDNLVDGRRITLQTNEEDSEILDVRYDGLVLYRVNDSIFSAQIEGDKLSAPTLVVKDDDVPEVHWAFWSPAPASVNPSKPPASGH